MGRKHKKQQRREEMSIVKTYPNYQSSKHCDWSVANNDVLACSRQPEVKVYVPETLWQTWIGLADTFTTEWLAYLRGVIVENEIHLRDDGMYFPPQSVSGAHVHSVSECDDYAIQEGTVGAIHSHVRMSAKFSTTDKESANWPLELVVNARGEYEASYRVQLPCGSMMRCSAKLYRVGATDLPIADLTTAITIGEEEKKKQKSFVETKKSSSLLHLYDKEGLPAHYRDVPQMLLSPGDYDEEAWEALHGGNPPTTWRVR